MPALSPTMTEGNLAKWLKREGDEVHSGDVLAEIETDKATMEVEAIDDGRVGKILVPEGTQGVKVNQPIALLLGEGEDAAALTPTAPADSAAPASEPATAAAPPPPPPPHESENANQPPLPVRPQAAIVGNGHDRRIFASPLARRMAQQAGLDLATLTGSGPQGRIVKSDIEAAILKGRQPTPPLTARADFPACRHTGRGNGDAVACVDARNDVVQGAGAGTRRQSAIHRATAQRDAAGHSSAPHRVRSRRSRTFI